MPHREPPPAAVPPAAAARFLLAHLDDCRAAAAHRRLTPHLCVSVVTAARWLDALTWQPEWLDARGVG